MNNLPNGQATSEKDEHKATRLVVSRLKIYVNQSVKKCNAKYYLRPSFNFNFWITEATDQGD